MKTTTRILVASAAALLLAAGPAGAQTSNYWNNPASGTWNWMDSGNWSSPTVPTNNTIFPIFTNKAATAYTVQFTNNVTSAPFRVGSDKVALDLNGKTWTCPPTGYFYGTQVPAFIAANAGETSTVTFSSSAAGGQVNMLAYDQMVIGAGGTMRLDASLGSGVTLETPYVLNNLGTITLDGASTLMRTYYIPYNGGSVLIENGATWFAWAAGLSQGGSTAPNASLVVSNNGVLLTTRDSAIGGTVLLVSNGLWTARWDYGGGFNLGYSGSNGKLIIDASTLNGDQPFLNVGNGSDRGQLWVQNGGLLVLSNGNLNVNAGFTGATTNMLVLNNGTVRLGSKTVTGYGGAINDGVITNRSLLRGSGTIVGQGNGPALVYNAATLEIGNSIGTLTLSNASYYAAPSSTTLFELSPTGSDLLSAPNGSLTFLGTNLFVFTGGVPSPHAKYGIGSFTFLVASNVTYTPAYDNLVYMLTNTYQMNYGVDFQFGVVNLGGGLFALELTFVPEPSTVMLLGLGGLLALRRFRRARKARSAAVTAVIGFTVLLSMTAGTTLAAPITNYWNNTSGGAFNTAGNWSLGYASTNYIYTAFTNNASVPYTVQFTTSATSYPFRVTTDKVTFDLTGKTWNTPPVGYYVNPDLISWYSGETSTVTFSSSAAGGVVNAVEYNSLGIGTNATVNIDNSLGYGITFHGPYSLVNYGTVTLSGTGVLYDEWPQFGGNYNTVTIKSNAFWDITGGGWYQYNPNSVTVVDSGGQLRNNRDSSIAGTLNILTNGRWAVNWGWESGGVNLGNSSGNGKLVIDSGRVDHAGGWFNIGNSTYRGQVWVQNGGLLVISNGSLTVTSGNTGSFTNMLVLNNGTVRLGHTNTFISGPGGTYPAFSGVLTNQSIVRGSGTLAGQGAGRFTFYNARILDIGNSIGTLNISNGNYVAAPSSTTIFELSPTGSDLLYGPDSTFTFLGTNQFVFTGAVPSPHAKYGVGSFTFVVGSNVTYSPAYDNLVNLLTNTYHLTYGVDFQYGVVSLPGGLFALELTFVPEPSTVMLLALGALLVWRRMAKRGERR